MLGYARVLVGRILRSHFGESILTLGTSKQYMIWKDMTTRKREVTEFRKMNADEQWDVIMAFPASMRGVSRPKNATERIKLFSKLNKKT